MAVVRVEYRERQRLQAADFRAEQDYRLGVAGRHHVLPHEWGVVRGLRVELQPGGEWSLEPGVAIDGNGRELVVPTPVPIDTAGVDAAIVALCYCEDPLPARRRAGCRDPQPSRTLSRVQLALRDAVAVPDESDANLMQASAAGTASSGPWLVPVARIERTAAARGAPGGRIRVHYDITRYVAHRAATLRAPRGHALLQLGYRSSSDAYSFVLRTGDTAASLMPRLAFDRESVIHVWQPLAITGSDAIGLVHLDEHESLLVRAHAPARSGRFLRVHGVIDLTRDTLSVEASELGSGQSLIYRAERSIAGRLRTDMAIALGRLGRFHFRLFDRRTDRGVPLAARSVVAGAPQPAPIPFELTLTRAGGAVAVRSTRTAAVASQAGPRSRSASTTTTTPVLRFDPATGLAPDPSTRAVFSVFTSAPGASSPATALRISAGAPDSSDVSARLSVRATVTDATGASQPNVPLSLNGAGRLTIRGAGSDEAALRVDGAVYLAPIGKSDPLLPELSSLVQIAALYFNGKLGASSCDVDDGTAAHGRSLKVPRGTDAHYRLNVTPAAGETIRRCIELITDGSSWLSFRPIHLGTHHHRRINIPNYSPNASNVYLRVWLLLSNAGQPCVALAAHHLTIQMT